MNRRAKGVDAMPANLTPDYYRVEEEYKSAKTPDEKLACLHRMLAVMPKHKGTDKLQADLKRRISQLKERQELKTRKKGPSFRVKPEGAGQIMLIGPPNSGKSALLAALSHAEPEVADYPFTTHEPLPGMVSYRDIKIQFVDLPPVCREHCESFVFDNIRGCDGALAIVDLNAEDPAIDFQQIAEILREKHLYLIPPGESGESDDLTIKRIPALLVLNKCDADPGGELIELVREMLGAPLPFYAISTKTKDGLDALIQAAFDLLNVIRVYTKQPGKPPDLHAPFTTPTGSTVMQFAELVHKDFVRNLKSARVWGSSKFDGQIVQHDHVLQDGDIIELSI